MNKPLRWALATLVLVAIGFASRGLWLPKLAGGKAASTAPGMQANKASAAATAASAPAIELTPNDVVIAATAELQSTLAISGGLRAVNSAMLRAKVAAEVKEVTLREGDRVVAGQVLVRLDDTEYQWRLRQAEDQAAAARAQLDIAERTLANNKALVDQGFISKTALDTSLMSAEGARASLQAAKAAAEIARKAVSDSVLRAPLAGLVAQRLVQPGERVGVDARLVEIVDLSKLELEAALAAEDVATLRPGQLARLQIDGMVEPVSARVARINPSTQAGTRAVMVYLAVDAHPALRQGLFARGSIETQRRQALVVPTSALRLDQAQPYVLLAEGGQVRQATVSLGGRGEVSSGAGRMAVTEITRGLAAGAVVLQGSVGALREGARVRLPAAPASPASPAAAAAAPSAPPAASVASATR